MRSIGLVLAMGALLAGCAGTQVSPAPSASTTMATPEPTAPSAAPSRPSLIPTPTADPSAGPPPTPNPVPGGRETLAVDSIAVVVINGLVARTMPSLDEPSQALEPPFNAGEDVFVIAGPVTASGYDWYEIHGRPDEAGSETAWLPAASQDGVPWLLPKRNVCPEGAANELELSELRELDVYSGVGLACFGSEELTFDATLGAAESCGAGEAWTIQPGWLGDPCWNNDYMWIEDPARVGTSWDPIAAAFAPLSNPHHLAASNDSETYLSVTITGQFDHPAARGCRVVPRDGWAETTPPTPDGAIFRCRAQFAITSIQER